MAQYNFEGAIEGISEQQLEFINKVIIEQGLNDAKVQFETVGQAGDNYSSEVRRLTVEGENGTLNLIAKIAPTNEMARLATSSDIMFSNEHLMYTEVFPTFLELQKNADIPESERLRFPKCYGSNGNESSHEVIILEDLKTSDFVMLDRFESLSDECVRSMLRNFAIFHSLSHVLKQKNMEKYNHFKDSLVGMWSLMEKMDFMAANFEKMDQTTVSLLDNKEHKDIVRNKISTVLRMHSKQANLDKHSKHSVLRQGDSWTNNMMFKFEEGELKESIMIDYQLSNHGNPTYDLLYMIFNCTDHKARAQHFPDWIDYYHSELDKSLSQFGLKANFIYPRDQLDADLKRYGNSLFGFSLILSCMLTLKSDEASKMKESMKNSDNLESMDMAEMFSANSNETINLLKAKIVGLIDSYKMFGLMS